jgi:hypothetical protein
MFGEKNLDLIKKIDYVGKNERYIYQLWRLKDKAR